MSEAEWITKAEEFINDIASSDLDDGAYCRVLEEVVDKAQTALDAKREEMDRQEDNGSDLAVGGTNDTGE